VGIEVGRFLTEFELANPVVAKEEKSTSAAWFVTPSNLVTCAHCTEGVERMWFTDPDGERVDLRLVDRDQRTDVALLEVAGPEWRSAATLRVAKRIPRVAEQVWGLGYPLTQFVGGSVKYTEGVVSSHEGLGGMPQHYSVTMPIRPGSSGGPMFDASGNVCGIMDSTLKAKLVYDPLGHVAPEFNYAVKVEHIRAMLERHGIPGDGVDAPPLPPARADAVESACRAVVRLRASKRAGVRHGAKPPKSPAD